MLSSRTRFTRFNLLSLLLIMGGLAGGCSVQREAILSKLELDRLFHRVDVAADRAQQERLAQERLAQERRTTSYWGSQSSTLERELARPDPNTATSSDELMSSRPGATPIEIEPIARTATPQPDPRSEIEVSSPSESVPQAEGQIPSPPPPPKLVELPGSPRPATTESGRVAAIPVVPATAEINGSSVRASETSASDAASGAGVMQPSFYGVASNPAELLEGDDKPVSMGNEVVVASEAEEEVSLFSPAFGSMTLVDGAGNGADPAIGSEGGAAAVPLSTPVPKPRQMVESVVSGPTSSSEGSESTEPDRGETEDWANLISSIRPFSSHVPAVETPVGE